MNHVVLGLVALVAIVLLTLGPAPIAPLAGALLALTTVCATFGKPPRSHRDV